MTDTIEDKVKQIISEQLGVPVRELKNDWRITHDLDADSIDVVELMMGLEDEFQIEIPDEESDQHHTVQSIIDAITKQVTK